MKDIFIVLLIVAGNFCHAQSYMELDVDQDGVHPPPVNYTVPSNSRVGATEAFTELEDFPIYGWSYGCVPTCAAMVIAWFDRNGYPCLYTGSVNGGRAPSNGNTWTYSPLPAVDHNGNSITAKNWINPISASRNGFYGLSDTGNNGHVDNFFVKFSDQRTPNNLNNDVRPVTGNKIPTLIYPTNHKNHGDIADYLGTSIARFRNYDGYTTSVTKNEDDVSLIYTPEIGPYYAGPDPNNPERQLAGLDGIGGVADFITNNIGYNLAYYFNRKVVGASNTEIRRDAEGKPMKDSNNKTLYDNFTIKDGFTFEDFKGYIDQGVPVVLHYSGHSVVGFGYNSDNNRILIATTWTTTKTRITWGSPLVTSSGKSLSLRSASVYRIDPSQSNRRGFRMANGKFCEGDLPAIITAVGDTEKGLFDVENSTPLLFLGEEGYFQVPFGTFDIEFYHAGGTYKLATNKKYSFNIPSSLPNYDWALNEDGQIIGAAILHAGGIVSDVMEIAISLAPRQIEKCGNGNSNSRISTCDFFVYNGDHIVITDEYSVNSYTSTIHVLNGGKLEIVGKINDADLIVKSGGEVVMRNSGSINPKPDGEGIVIERGGILRMLSGEMDRAR